jgi:hypothetical protein
MNTDMVKERLLELRPTVEDFTVILSGKKSKKVNGLYKPLSREIILHNRNFQSDNELMFTAIHEFAHHVQFSGTLRPIVARVHTGEFWDIFHGLLWEAERQGLYENVFTNNPEFIALTERIKGEYIAKHGKLIQEFGDVLLLAHELCDKYNANFSDYVNRILKIKHSHAYSLIKLSNAHVGTEHGYENMKTLARIRDDGERKRAEKDLQGDFSPSMIAGKYGKKKEEPDPISALQTEKKRLEQSIETLQKKLTQVEQKLKEMQTKGA